MENRSYLFIGDSFPKQYDELFAEKGKFNFSNTIFNNLVVEALQQKYKTFVVSAPYVGHYPIFSKTRKMNETQVSDNHYLVKYNNLIGVNAYSKTKHLVKCFKKHSDFKEDLNIVVSETHLHNMKAALKIKKHCPGSKITLLVFDLPDNVNGVKKSKLYSFLKNINNKKIYKLARKMDGFIYLSEEMNKKMNPLNKPYFVIPGLADLDLYKNTKLIPHNKKIISYCGVLSKQFNVDNLVNAFKLLNNDSYELVLAGKGDVVDYINQLKDPRIKYLGMVSRNKALEIQLNSDVLVNPRLPNQQFADESFPSKTFQYLLTYKPTVCYAFASFPKDIKELVLIPESNEIKDLANSIDKAMTVKWHSKDKIDSVLMKYSPDTFVKKTEELFDIIRRN